MVKRTSKLSALQVQIYLEKLELSDVAAQLTENGTLPSEALTVAMLDRLIEAHQLHVPFENCQIYDEQIPLSLDIDDLYQKIVIRNRGGFCFELNGLFSHLLLALGFDEFPVFSRNVRNLPVLLPLMHRAELVRINGELRYADVGYGGPMAACSLPVEGATVTESYGQDFRITAMEDEHWWLVEYSRAGEGNFQQVVHFQDTEAYELDFIPLSFYCEAFPTSSLKNNRICNLRTVDGSVYLRNLSLTVNQAGQRTVMDITPEELPQVLKENFGIVLQ